LHFLLDCICCAYDQGSYLLKVNGEAVEEGGAVASFEAIKFPINPAPPSSTHD